MSNNTEKSGLRSWNLKDDGWRRVGTLIARIHNAGQAIQAPNRVRLHPLHSTQNGVQQLIEGRFISSHAKLKFKAICDQITIIAADLFTSSESIRIHDDCHGGNVLRRPETGFVLINFDDMMMGPPIQYLWLHLPDFAD